MSDTAQQTRDLEAAKFIVRCLNIIQKDEAALNALPTPQQGSALRNDEQILPELSVAAFIQSKLVVGYGHITVLAKVLGLNPDEEISTLSAPPYGCFELIRTAMECAAHALWVIAPDDAHKRLERRLYSHAEEIENVEQFLKASQSANLEQIDDRKARLQEFSLRLGEDSTPWKKKIDTNSRDRSKMPGIANMFVDVQKFKNPQALGGFETSLSWNAIWRGCSGAAHGSAWSMTLLNRIEPIEGTREGSAENHLVSPNYDAIKFALFGATEILASALDRFAELSLKHADEKFSDVESPSWTE